MTPMREGGAGVPLNKTEIAPGQGASSGAQAKIISRQKSTGAAPTPNKKPSR
jgi:hypothetical protein